MAEYFAVLVATVIIEAGVVLLCGPGSQWHKDRTRALIVPTVLALNLLTHPTATLATGGGACPWFAAEVLVALAEAVGYRALAGSRWSSAIAASAAANTVTSAVGWLWF